MELEHGLRRLRAPNAGPMTFTGTNTYLLGRDEIAVIDPGPDDPDHLAAILREVGRARVAAILVTHSHLDHSPLARPLAQATGAPIYAAGDSTWGRSAIMDALAAEGSLGGGEGVDTHFAPDRQLAHGAIIEASDWRIETLATPGHMANHLSFVWNGALFSGDLVMGWATSVVSPPDGDMTDFYTSLAQLMARRDRVYYPGHGEPVTDPAARLTELHDHRRARECAILSALADSPATAQALTVAIYTDIDARLIPMAHRNVLAHLIDLESRNEVFTQNAIRADSLFSRV